MRDAVAWIALVAGSLFGCSTSSEAGGSDASEDRIAVDASSEARLDAPADSTSDVTLMPYEAATPPALGGIRVANFSATTPPIDFCLAPHGTTKWQGPILAAAGPQSAADYGDGSAPGLTLSDGGTAGLGFPGITSYFDLAPGQYDARFVAAGSPTCSVPVVAPDATLPALAKEAVMTVALFTDIGGDAGSAGFKVAALADDLSVPPASVVGPGRFAVRFINAAPSVPSVDFGTGPPGVFMGGYEPMFGGVLYGQASNPSETTISPPFVDNNGYLFKTALLYSAPLGGSSFSPSSFSASVLQDENPAVLAIGGTGVAAGAVVTVILLAGSPGSPANDAGGEAGVQLLQCLDNGGAATLAGPCTVISQ
jgi:hypothetical protein